MVALFVLSLSFVAAIEDGGNFEILAPDAQPARIDALRSSPDGKYLLATIGPGISNHVFVFRGSAFVDDVIPRSATGGYVLPKFIDNRGAVIGDYVVKTRAGSSLRTFRFARSGASVIPLPEGDLSWTEFKSRGLTQDGEILGCLSGDMAVQLSWTTPETLLEQVPSGWKDGDLRRYGSFPRGAQAVAATREGVILEVCPPPGPKGFSGALPAVLYPNGPAQFLPLPSGSQVATIESASSTGSVIVGASGPNLGVSSATIWRDGRAYSQRWDPGSTGEKLFGVSEDGTLAVGVSHGKRADTAIVWDGNKGVASLAEFAKARNVLVPEGWSLTSAVGISPDGKTIYGTATNGKKSRPFAMTLKP